MTRPLAAWRDLAARIRIDGPIPTRFEFDEPPESRFSMVPLVRACVLVEVPERDGGRLVEIAHGWALVFGDPDPRQLHALARAAWLHELDEFFLVDGVRTYDPHAGEVSRPTPQPAAAGAAAGRPA